MAIDFPASPNVNDVYTDPATGQSWTWDGTKWVGGSGGISYWQRNGTTLSPYTAGDTVSGNLSPLNGSLGFRNWVINGDFSVNQRNGSRTPGVGVYGFDRWKGHANGLEQVVEALPAGQYTLSWSGGGNGTFAGTTGASPITATVGAAGNEGVVVPSAATLVQLEAGPIATAFEDRPIGTELALCQRYYFASTASAGSPIAMVLPGSTSNTRYVNIYHPVTMRSAPTTQITLSTGAAGGASAYTVDFAYITTNTGNSTTSVAVHAYTADAEL